MAWYDQLIEEFQPFADDLVTAAGRAGLQPRVTSTRRSHREQKRLYDRFLRGESAFPALPPGQSAHEYGYAFDMVTAPFEALEDVGYTWQTWGGLWGGAHDPVHFEYPGFAPPTETTDLPTWEKFIAGLPIGFWPSALFALLGIPYAARKNVSPEQESELRRIIHEAGITGPGPGPANPAEFQAPPR